MWRLNETSAARNWILLLAAMLVTGLHTDAAAVEKETLAAIKKIGGTVRLVAGNRTEWKVEFHLGGRQLTDKDLVHVAALKNIASLNLRDTEITGDGLVHLKGLTKLEWLHLERTDIGDEGISNLAGLVNLQYLNLYGTRITDKSLDQLSGLKNLKRLYVWKTGVTDEGVARIEKALPNLKVIRGVDLSNLPASVPSEPEKPGKPIKWIAVSKASEAPKSENGENTEVVFENKSDRKVKIYWVSYGDELKLYGELEPGKTHRQNTYANNTWLISDENDKPLGYFIVGPEKSLAVIPQ